MHILVPPVCTHAPFL